MKRQLEDKVDEKGPKRQKVDQNVKWRIRMKPATRFCEMIDSVSKLNVNEARIQITKTGMRLGCLDSSHIATVLVVIHGEADTVLEYQAGAEDDEDGQLLDVSVPSLSKLCKIFLERKEEGTVTLEAYRNKSGYVLIFEDKGLVRFELNELDLQSDETAHERPDTYAPDCVVRLPGSTWKKKINEMDKFGGDTIYLSATKEFGLRLQCKCGELGNVDMKLPIGEQVTSVELKKPDMVVEGIPMALKYLKHFADGAGIDGRPVELHLNVGIPLVMKVLLDDTGSFKEYMLAPKATTHEEGTA